MRKLFFATVSSLALLTATTGAQAADVSQPQGTGIYIGAFGGLSLGAFGSADSYAWDHDMWNDGIDTDYQSTEEWWSDSSVGNGWLAGGVIGMRVAPNLRGEVEVSYAKNRTENKMLWSCDNVDNNACQNDNYDSSASQKNRSNMNSLFVLGNVWYDFAPDSTINPYIGFGVGAAKVSGGFKSYIDDNSTANNVENAYINQTFTGWAPAGQIGAGVGVRVTDNVSLDVGYRFKAVLNAKTDVHTNYEVESDYNDQANYSASKKTSFGVHAVQVGLTFGF